MPKMERTGPAVLTIHSAVFGRRGNEIQWFRVGEVKPYAQHERTVDVVFRERPQPNSRRKQQRAFTTVVPNNIRYLTVEAEGRVIYDSREDVPCDMGRWNEVAAKHCPGLLDSPPSTPSSPRTESSSAGGEDVTRDLLVPSAAVQPVENLEALAGRINAEHEAVTAAAVSALEHARRAGEMLLEARARCPHGTWLLWLATNVRCSQRTAYNYIQIAESWDKLATVATSGLRDALAILSAKQEPETPEGLFDLADDQPQVTALEEGTGTEVRPPSVVANGSPELKQAMDRGEVSVSAAATLASLPPAEQREVIEKGPEAAKEKAKEIRETQARQRQEREEAARNAEARWLWFRDLGNTLRWIDENVAQRRDEHLVWYAESLGSDPACAPDGQAVGFGRPAT
jgi:hypothetical protein